MITDARTIPADTTIKTDLCIVGAGAAGITIARELIGEPIQVCLLEAGGLESDAVSSSMNAGENVGLPYFPLDETRSRHFGGGTNLWAGWCRPLEALDLETRPWVPASGWPISLDTLNPYYRRAQQLCDIPTYQYEATAWRDRLPELYRIRNLGPDTHVTVWQASPPTRFGREFRDEIRRAANVHTYLYANVSELETNETGTAVTRARVACIGGKTLRVDARIFVLAAGGIETPRILLLSSRFSADGLGNQHGNVGRFFMEHPHVVTGRLKLTNRAASRRETIAAIDRGPRGAMDRLRLLRPKGRLRCAFALSPDMQRAEQLLNYSAHLRPVATMPNDDAYKSLRLLVGNIRSFGHASRVLRNGKSVHEMRRHVARVIGSPAALATAAYREFVARPTHLEIYSQSEQSPNRNSRITLSASKDLLGANRVRLDWQMTDLDRRTLIRGQEIIGRALERAGIGTVVPEPWLLEDGAWPESLSGGHHHMGTARMTSDPSQGVVDANCRVHGVTNLYVTDGSVLPTAGYANPLLTIVALALRTAAHLKDSTVRERRGSYSGGNRRARLKRGSAPRSL